MISPDKVIVCIVSFFVCAFVSRGGAAQTTAGAIEVRECVVYSVQEPANRVDCLNRAREICNGKPLCELPIGLALSNGRDIDPRSGKKVKVRLSCGPHVFVQGPHDQDDHAMMILLCPG
jgi:hypothetical protein